MFRTIVIWSGLVLGAMSARPPRGNIQAAHIAATGGKAPLITLYDLEHNLGPNRSFVTRAELRVEAGAAPSVEVVSQKELGSAEVSSLQELLAQNGFYRLRLRSKDGEAVALTSVRSCDVHRADLQDAITVHLDGQGTALGLSYATHIPYFAPACAAKPVGETPKAFKTAAMASAGAVAATFRTDQAGGRPPPGMEKVKAFADKVEKPPEKQGFFAKYWYIILPMLFILFTGGGVEPPAQGEGAPAAAAPAPTSGGGGAPKASGRSRSKRQR